METRSYLLFLLILNLRIGISCDCTDSVTLETSFKDADVVFIGKVIDVINDSDIPYYTLKLDYSVVQIEKIYKGIDKIESGFNIPIFDFKSSCDFNFQKGKSYIILGIYPDEGRFVYTSKCMYTKHVARLTTSEKEFLEKQIINDCLGQEKIIKIE